MPFENLMLYERHMPGPQLYRYYYHTSSLLSGARYIPSPLFTPYVS